MESWMVVLIVAAIAIRPKPATNISFAATPDGNIYGPAHTPDQVIPFRFSSRAPIDGLYLCGASVMSAISRGGDEMNFPELDVHAIARVPAAAPELGRRERHRI